MIGNFLKLNFGAPTLCRIDNFGAMVNI